MFPIPKNPAQRQLLAMWFLLRAPERWTKNAFARRGYLRLSTDPMSRDAQCWCEIGAGVRTNFPPGAMNRFPGPPNSARAALRDTVPDRGMMISTFNDSPTTSHNDILAHLCRAYDCAGQYPQE
jgi:hypothetical protein